jgi:hypothetical protein
MDIKEWAEKIGATIEELPLLPPVAIGAGPWKLYIYGKNGYHTGGKWFRKGPPKYPEEEITAEEARMRTARAIQEKREVRIADSRDRLVFHSERGVVIAPANPQDFWDAAGA